MPTDAKPVGTEPSPSLFHWAPTERRRQIIRYGLRPSQRTTVSSGSEGFRQPVICLAESPSWAWGLSGAFYLRGYVGDGTPIDSWDLWQTDVARLVDPEFIETYDDRHRWHEVRTEHRIYKRDLWYVATRLVTP